MNKIPWWIDCEKGDLILPGSLGIMTAHSGETYQPTSIMRWDRGIFNGSNGFLDGLHFENPFESNVNGVFMPAYAARTIFVSVRLQRFGNLITLWWTNIAMENDHF